MPATKIGFIGLGIMGLPMAKNLHNAGYTVIGHNRSTEPVEELVEYGAESAPTPAAATRQSDVVITCLPDTKTVSQVMRGEDGVFSAVSEGMTVIDMSTISPVVTEELATDLDERGVSMLDAPISGGETGAVDGTLSIMIGGDESILKENRNLFEVLGETITFCGPHGTGQVTKACNQIIGASTLVAVSEALVFAKKAGADLEAVISAASGGAAACWALENRASQMIRGNFDPGFFGSYHYKDLRIATDAGEAFGSVMPVAESTHEMYKAMEANDIGCEDTASVIKIIEMLSGTEARIED